VPGSHRDRAAVVIWAMLLGAAGALLAAALGGSAAPGQAAQSKTFVPVADAHVRAEYRNANFGNESDLRSDGSPMAVSYVRFDLTGSGSLTSAVLRLRSLKDSPGVGIAVQRVGSNSWTEGGINYVNAPAVGGIIDQRDSFDEGEWISLDVGSVVKGNQVVTLALTTTNQISRRVASSETSSSPQLVVGLASPPPTTTTNPPPTTTTNPPPTTTNPPPTTTNPPPQSGQPGFPIRAAFYYPWFPEAWNQKGISPYTKYTPTLGSYRSNDAATIEKHVRSLEYGRVEAAISSWWGQGTKEDTRFPQLLSETKRLNSPLRWAPYYEEESLGDPTPTKLAADLAYIKSRFASDPAYLRIGGRPVIFVFATGSDGCGMADRWKTANASRNFYVVLKVFSGYRNCSSQPASWHQYGPAKAADRQAGYSYAISPGFNKADEPSPRLARDLARFDQNVRDMVASAEPWQLVTTFNEWGEGTSVESAAEWASASGHGKYLDVLHNR
jgi:glycosyl hydrolase family 99